MAASKMKQILELDPCSELAFHGPFEHVVTSYLELKNPSDKRVCFKVKTTAPKRYCVRPNSGIVEPSGKIRIAIMLQPLDPGSEVEARNKHKFMVQSTIINSDDENIPLETVWQLAQAESIMDSKLKCVFPIHGGDEAKASIPDLLGGFKHDSEANPKVAAAPLSAQTTTTTNTSNAIQEAEPTQKQRVLGENKQSELINSSTPLTSRVTTSSKTLWEASPAPPTVPTSSRNLKLEKAADKSLASSHNLTSSFMQPMSDDYKIVIVSIVMLVLGIIMGKYII